MNRLDTYIYIQYMDLVYSSTIAGANLGTKPI